MVWRLRHSQRKRGETDGPNLPVLRQSSTLPGGTGLHHDYRIVA
jgi:hypothetical protein